MNLIGYQLSAFHNGDYFYDDEFMFTQICPACNSRTNFQEHNPAYRQRRKRRSALLGTYDGQYIVTKAFKEFCEMERYDGVELLGFTHDPEHFHLVLQREQELDETASKVEQLFPCAVCGIATFVSGARPAYLTRHEPLPDGFWRSNQVFGDGYCKFPLIFVGLETREKMKAAGLKCLLFRAVYGREACNV